MPENQSAADDRLSQPRAGSDQERKVEVTLQEAYTGTTRLVELAGGRCFAVKIPPGVATGTRVRFAGYGLSGRAGGSPGDLYLLIKVRPCSSFQRRGNDLYHQYAANLAELALGGEIPIRTLNGRTLALALPAGTLPGQQFRLAGAGMPQLHQPDERGDLYVTVNATLPRGGKIPDQQTSREEGKTTKQQTPQEDASGEPVFIALLLTALFVAGIGAGLLLYWLILE
jgi:DnaJ-class molecular chaperone